MKSKIYIIIIALVCATFSCIEMDIEYDTNGIEYRPLSIAMPIAKIHVPLYYFLEKELENTSIDDDGVICIRYTHSEKMEWNDTISIDDFHAPEIVKYTFISGVVQEVRQSVRVNLTIKNNENSYVNEAELLSGNISFSFSGDRTSELEGAITITIPELTRDGIAFEEVILFPSAGESFPLEGYQLKTNNNHKVMANFTMNAGGAGSLTVDMSLTDIDVSYLSGYFGELEYRPQDRVINFDFFDKLDVDGIFGVQKVKLNTKLTNRTGIPINITSDVCFAFGNGLSDQQLELEDDIDLDVPIATESGANHTVTPAEKYFSTLLPQIEFEGGNYPTGLKLKNLKVNANPDGISPDGKDNFLVKYAHDYLANVDFNIDVPLIVRIDEYNRADIVAFDYNKITGNDEEIINNIEDMIIKLEIVNGLPFDVALSAVATDADNFPVEIILKKSDIAARAEAHYFPIELSQEQLNEFQSGNVKNIVLYTTSTTEDYVTVKEDSFIDIGVSVQFKSSILSALFE